MIKVTRFDCYVFSVVSEFVQILRNGVASKRVYMLECLLRSCKCHDAAVCW
jgi:hypothetical protein